MRFRCSTVGVPGWPGVRWRAALGAARGKRDPVTAMVLADVDAM